jgi:hypothetical protein
MGNNFSSFGHMFHKKNTRVGINMVRKALMTSKQAA